MSIRRESLGPATLFRLDNGLRLIVLEDHRSPVAAVNAWVRCGANLEPEGVRGWSHGIEHMVFKGTARRGERDFALAVADLGGRSNAGTGYETTNYHITLPAGGVASAVDLLADILFHAAFTPEALDAERRVLVHENHLHDDQPGGYGLTWRLAMALACDRSPYRRSIGGEDADLLHTPRERILAYWHAAYRPERTTFVVVGDVETEQLLPEILPLLAGGRRPTAPSLPAPPVEPLHTAPRCRAVPADVHRLYAKLVIPALPEGHPDRPVVELLRQLLAGGESSRLIREVREREGLASEISVLSETGPREGWLVVDWESDPDRGAAALDAVLAQLAALAAEPVPPPERECALARARLAHAGNRETVQGQAALLGWHDLMGDARRAWTLPARLAAVTPADIRRVAATLFHPDRLSLLLYGPVAEPGLPRDAAQLAPHLAPLATACRSPGAGVPQRPASPTPVTTLPPATTGRPSARSATFTGPRAAGGLTLTWRADSTLPLATVAVVARGGVGWGPPGLAALAQRVQVKGVPGRDAAGLAAAWEALGVSVWPLVGRDATGLVCSGLSDHLDDALALLAEMAASPTFPVAELDLERRQALAELAAQEDEPFAAAARRLRERFYGDHPYGPPVTGTPASLAALTRSRLQEWHAALWRPANLLVVASGDLDGARLSRWCASLAHRLPAGPAPRVASATALPPPAPPLRLVRPTRQQVVLLAFPGPERADRDRAPLALWQTLLNGQSGRLFEQLRNRRSLCYASGVQAVTGLGSGMLAAYVLTAPDQAAEARDALLAELHATADRVVPAAELDRARRRLRGNLLINRQTHGDRVSRGLFNLLLGRDPDDLEQLLAELDAVTPASLRTVMGRYLAGEPRAVVELGPAADAGPVA